MMALADTSLASITEHITELKKRVAYALLTWLVATSVCYFFAEPIYQFLVHPLAEAAGDESKRMIYTGLTEAFFTYLKLAMWGGFVLAFPVIASQLYLFIAPGLYRKEKRAILPFLIAAPLLFAMGAGLLYFLILPMAWEFFLGFESTGEGGLPIALEARVSEYLSLIMQLIIAFGLAFQLPLMMMLLVKAGLVEVAVLKRYRKYAILIVFVCAAMLTPPDIISQIGLAVPMLLLYEIALWGCSRIEKKKE